MTESTTLERALLQSAEELRSGTPAVDPVALDPVAWCREVEPCIESKRHGLIPFEPRPYQADIMRRIAGLELRQGVWQPRVAGYEKGIVDKARQIGITTAIMVVAAHQLLHRFDACGQPFHGHVVANLEEVAIGSLLKKAKTALSTAKLPPGQRRALRGIDPGVGNATISYFTGGAQNSLMAHTSGRGAGRSMDGNFVFMDEVAHLPFAEEIYAGLVTMLDDDFGSIWLVSTYHGDGDFFCDMVDNAEQAGFTHIPLDWRVMPGRNEAWKRRDMRKLPGREDTWLEENELTRQRAGEQALNMALVKELDRRCEWLGPELNPTHQYSKGVDLAGRGEDKVVFCVVDILARPAQVVFCEALRRTSTPKTAEAIAELDAAWPGPLWIDGTNDNTMPSNVKLLLAPGAKLTAVHLSSGQDPRGRDYRDKENGINWASRPRLAMDNSLVSNLEHGRLVVHLDAFPELAAALRTWSREPGTKRRGRNPDYLDSLLLSNLSLTRVRGQGQNRGITSAPNESRIAQRPRRW